MNQNQNTKRPDINDHIPYKLRNSEMLYLFLGIALIFFGFMAAVIGKGKDIVTVIALISAGISIMIIQHFIILLQEIRNATQKTYNLLLKQQLEKQPEKE